MFPKTTTWNPSSSETKKPRKVNNDKLPTSDVSHKVKDCDHEEEKKYKKNMLLKKKYFKSKLVGTDNVNKNKDTSVETSDNNVNIPSMGTPVFFQLTN